MNRGRNRAIELHDTTVAGIVTIGTQVAILLGAYIHESDGHPARDAGTGWVQAVVVTFSEAVIEGEVPELPSDIWTGTLILDGEEQRNIVPIPFQYMGKITMKLHLDAPAEIQITGTHAGLTLIGEPVYVEEFPGI